MIAVKNYLFLCFTAELHSRDVRKVVILRRTLFKKEQSIKLALEYPKTAKFSKYLFLGSITYSCHS